MVKKKEDNKEMTMLVRAPLRNIFSQRLLGLERINVLALGVADNG